MIALSLVGMCSCRAVSPSPKDMKLPVAPRPASPEQQEPPEQRTSQAIDHSAHMARQCTAPGEPPLPAHAMVPWSPPGIAGPWPHDEYLLDGGDRDVQVNLGPGGRLQGLELEDTVVLYDTIDGRTCIEPSNRVCLYAPRFAATRKVTSVVLSEQTEQPVGARMPVKPLLNQEGLLATTTMQPVQAEGQIGRKSTSVERVGEAVMPAISRQPIAALDGGFATYENLKAIRDGQFEESEKPRLMEAIDAAITWTHDLAVQVILEGRRASEVVGDQRAQALFRVDMPNNPCLRVIKVASDKVAQPGDIVDFTIRFDNQGDTELTNVVLIDNLTTRLEYVDGSAQSSRSAEFSSEHNEGGSLVLRWELADPLPVGAGGLVRFHCRVR